MPEWSRTRLDLAISEYKKQVEEHNNEPFLINSALGTFHKPLFRASNGFEVFESTSMSKYLLARNIPSEKILKYEDAILFNHVFIFCYFFCFLIFPSQYASRDTIGDAFFTRMWFTELHKLCNLKIVTSDFHLSRATAIFEWVFSLPLSSSSHPTSACYPYKIKVIAAPNSGMAEKMVREREEKERTSLQSFEELKNKFKSLQELSQWLFSTHGAYCAQCKGKKTVDYSNKELMDTY